MKQQRWYKFEGDRVLIYDAPYPSKATSVSMVGLGDLAYYRRTFSLRKVWEDEQ